MSVSKSHRKVTRESIPIDSMHDDVSFSAQMDIESDSDDDILGEATFKREVKQMTEGQMPVPVESTPHILPSGMSALANIARIDPSIEQATNHLSDLQLSSRSPMMLTDDEKLKESKETLLSLTETGDSGGSLWTSLSLTQVVEGGGSGGSLRTPLMVKCKTPVGLVNRIAMRKPFVSSTITSSLSISINSK